MLNCEVSRHVTHAHFSIAPEPVCRSVCLRPFVSVMIHFNNIGPECIRSVQTTGITPLFDITKYLLRKEPGSISPFQHPGQQWKSQWYHMGLQLHYLSHSAERKLSIYSI